MINVIDFPVIDNHCHPYPYSREKRPFWRCFNSTLFEQTKESAQSTILMHLVTNELRDYMGMDRRATMDEIIEERNKRYSADPVAWVNALARDANIQQAIVDITYPITAWKSKKFITQEELDEYYAEVKDYKINTELRFEYIYDPLVPQALPFAEFLEKYYKTMDEAVQTAKPVTFKSVIGYITGLDVTKPTYQQGEIAYYKYLQDPTDFGSEKVFRDFMLYDSMKLCKKYGLPLHIHTGTGNTPLCNISRMNPVLLNNFLCDEDNRSVPTVLLHCGYPYLRETGYMASHFTQVYLDVSQMVYHAGLAAESGLKELLEMCPFNKIMYASDGGGIPEHAWYSAKYFKKALSRTLTYYCEMEVFDEATAEKYAAMILSENAKRLYGL